MFKEYLLNNNVNEKTYILLYEMQNVDKFELDKKV